MLAGIFAFCDRSAGKKALKKIDSAGVCRENGWVANEMFNDILVFMLKHQLLHPRINEILGRAGDPLLVK